MSGAVFEPRALEELFPDWRERGAPVTTPVTAERVAWLRGATGCDARAAAALVPRALRNQRQLRREPRRSLPVARRAGRGARLQRAAGFRRRRRARTTAGASRASSRATWASRATARTRATSKPATSCAPSTWCSPKAAAAASAAGSKRGSGCARAADPQHFGIGFKEIWQIDPAKHRPGEVVHTLGWPLDDATDGGGFVYHAADARVYLGFIVGLGYRNPHLDPFAEFQRWKQHPRIRELLAGGERISYGARAVNKGGLQSLPKLSFPGGVLVGCEAGFLNPAKIKGSHTAMKSGMLAAETIFAALAARRQRGRRGARALRRARARVVGLGRAPRGRNFSAGIAKLGTLLGGALAFVEQNLLRGRAPWTLRNRTPDHARLRARGRRADARRIRSPTASSSFDRASSVFLSSTAHEEDQPCHLEARGSRACRSPRTCRGSTSPRSAIARPACTRS